MSLYVEWLLLVTISLCVDALGVFIVPLAILFSDGRTLPRWAWIWDNDREPLGDDTRGAAIAMATGFKRGYLRWCWLALRNPGNNFGYLLGFDQTAALYAFSGDKLTSDQGHEGALYVTGNNAAGKHAFCFYYVKRWGATKCLRVFLGWKIHDMVNDGTKAQIVLVINPFMTFTGEAA